MSSRTLARLAEWRARARRAGVIFAGSLLPKPAKNFVKRFWDPWAPRRVKAHAPMRRAGVHPVRDDVPGTQDIICFSIIDWSFRWQRPQQIVSRLADRGHRVFVFRVSEFLVAGGKSYALNKLRHNVWEVTLAPPVPIDVYCGLIPPATTTWFPLMLEELRREADIVDAISIVQVATWCDVAIEARTRFGWKVLYDCMDEWTSFPGMKPALLQTEERLVARADIVTVSAQRLLDKWRGRNANIHLVRNGADFEHFNAPSDATKLEQVARPIAGYFGAIASWFDVALLARVAAARPQVSFVIVGGIFDVDIKPLRQLRNVHLLGQQPYASMPAYLRAFDVAIIPFVVSDITAATDPVKFYEYLSQGKPVVSTPMPELGGYSDLLYLARDEEDFIAKLDVALREDDDALRQRRIETARANTWERRVEVMTGAIRDAHPKVSVVIVSYNNRALTEACLESVLRNSMHPNLEVIVVDNASADDSVAMLQAIDDERVKIILNRENLGFAAANNQALRIATGAYLILLNNDTVVPRGWLPRMLRQLHDPEVGIAVAVTNFSGNESRIRVPYQTIEDMHIFAEEHMRQHAGERFDIRVAAMYCVGMRRDVFARVGELDEQFGIGMFEDDDYSHRIREAGLRVICAEDVFVHHIGQASFSKLAPDVYEELWKKNQAHFEAKWGTKWTPHQAR
jgi:GT2 family glycosyltransferase/glycosyltransferase involved in cell wall biosynthesis